MFDHAKSTLCWCSMYVVRTWLIDTVLVFDVCHEDMVNRHCAWCSMVSSVKWDNVQIEAHGCMA